MGTWAGKFGAVELPKQLQRQLNVNNNNWQRVPTLFATHLHDLALYYLLGKSTKSKPTIHCCDYLEKQYIFPGSFYGYYFNAQ